jgi:inorganic pyrophosphatase
MATADRGRCEISKDMKNLLTINDNNFEPQDYAVRKVVRAIILDESETRVLFFGSTLPGGGVEDGETDEQALTREAMEEIGARIEVIRPLGEIVAYRDVLRKKYVLHGYLCKQIGELGTPTSTDLKEQESKVQWLDIHEAIKKLETELQALTAQYIPPFTEDAPQARIQHRKFSLAFLKEIITDDKISFEDGKSKSLEMCRQYIGKKVSLIIDQAYGTYYKDTLYEQNYGYIPDTIAPDGEGLDAYFIGPQEPLEKAEGVVIAIIHRLDDDDDKLIVVPDGVSMTDEEIEAAVNFREKFFTHQIVR